MQLAAKMKWTREPGSYKIGEDKIEITTSPGTDLWQRTYYHFRNDNAPVLQMEGVGGDQPRILGLGDDGDPGGRKGHVVPLQPQGG